MKRATGYVEVEGGYKVIVHDGYWTGKMCELGENGDFHDCIFKTIEEAQKAIDDYNEVWNGRR